jgi:glycosyltransferase involved in cell wall biosynthesis
VPDPAPPLRVAVDATPVIGERSGVGHATAHLLAGLATRRDVVISGYAVTRRRRALLTGLLPAGVSAATSPIPARLTHRLWRLGARPRIEHWTGPVDVVHATNYAAPPAHAPVVVTVHDLGFAHHPDLCRPEALAVEGLIRRSLDHGATVHVLSDAMAEEAREYFGLPAERVARVYLGVDVSGQHGDAARGRAFAGAARYVLAISTVEPRKNYPRLLAAFDAVAASDPDLVLVIAGGDGWGVDAFDAALARTKARDRVHRLGYVGDDERADLLAGAHAVAYPSLYEGFGLVPLEAMAAGVPVMAGRAGALPEAVGDAALLADPLDVDDLAHALQRVCTDETLRARLVARGRDRPAMFSWERSVDEFVALYRRVATTT